MSPPSPLPHMLQPTSEFFNPAVDSQNPSQQQLHRGYLQMLSQFQSQCQGMPWSQVHVMHTENSWNEMINIYVVSSSIAFLFSNLCLIWYVKGHNVIYLT